jgi:uncharacterized membrane protein
MATLTVLKFETPEGAEQMIFTLEDLQKQRLITIQDAATVTWPVGKKGPKTRQLRSLTGGGALEGSFWGLLFGLLFFVPILGMAVGAAMGALAGSLSDVGIDDKFIAEVRGKVTEGTSALFLLTSGAVIDRLAEALKGQSFEIVATNFSTAEESKLREAFAA